MRKNYLRIAWACWLVGIITVTILARYAAAAEATFSWLPNTETDLAGYKIYYGPASRDYTTTIDCGLPAPVNGRVQYTVTDLPDTEMFFAATAYDTNGTESDFSVEVPADPAPGQVQGFSVTTTTTTTTTTTIAQ